MASVSVEGHLNDTPAREVQLALNSNSATSYRTTTVTRHHNFTASRSNDGGVGSGFGGEGGMMRGRPRNQSMPEVNFPMNRQNWVPQYSGQGLPGGTRRMESHPRNRNPCKSLSALWVIFSLTNSVDQSTY